MWMAMLSVVNCSAVISSMVLPVSFWGNLDSPMTPKLRISQVITDSGSPLFHCLTALWVLPFQVRSHPDFAASPRGVSH